MNSKSSIDTSNGTDPKVISNNPPSSEDEEDDSEEEDSLGKVVTQLGKEIDRKSAGNVRRSKNEIAADEEAENDFGYTDSMLLLTIRPKH